MEQNPKIELREIGSEGRLAVIVDEFSARPEEWRMRAAQSDFKSMGDYYPGPRTPVPQDYFADVGPLLGAIFRKAYGCAQTMSVERALYSLVTTAPKDLSLAQRIPHIDDTDPARYAMVHYLSPTDFGGTAFYRHRRSGFETITPDRHRHYLDRLKSDFEEKGEPEAGYIASDSALFEQVDHVDHRFNRAVIYPSNLLHCSLTRNDVEFPEDPMEGRLTVAAFILAR